ncbi:MAG: FAD-binding oxidoreductase [Martelella sp.]|uniref:NAD(P)/FAD-dependent oxidoreductase n=1 Tax=Martelella sp. TaxID=1969699 RepID=UPI0032425261
MRAAQPSTTPYWHMDLPPAPETLAEPGRKADLVVVGSGYTGLNAALVAARGGRSVLVLDAEAPGFGCSTRNGGQISTSVKPSLATLTAKFGERKARDIRRTGADALNWFGQFIADEGFDCDFVRNGRFHAAHTPEHYEVLVREAEKLRRDEGIETFAVPRAEQHKELGTDTYHGGVVYPKHCALQPAKYHRALMLRALEAGVKIAGNCRVTAIGRKDSGFEVSTEKGPVTARNVVVATNGYTTGATPWLQRRVIPIGSYMIATEELPEGVVDRLFPTGRIASDTCKVLYYYRASPDRKRILFGGRVSASEMDPAVSGPRLREAMIRIFPELASAAITHSWCGFVAYSFDELAHTGCHDGVHYALGYCGSGVSMASYLGMKAGLKVLGSPEGQTAFDDLKHPTRPFYFGKPWFLPAAVNWYRFVDKHPWAGGRPHV